jgi:hypothetical protein
MNMSRAIISLRRQQIGLVLFGVVGMFMFSCSSTMAASCREYIGRDDIACASSDEITPQATTPQEYSVLLRRTASAQVLSLFNTLVAYRPSFTGKAFDSDYLFAYFLVNGTAWSDIAFASRDKALLPISIEHFHEWSKPLAYVPLTHYMHNAWLPWQMEKKSHVFTSFEVNREFAEAAKTKRIQNPDGSMTITTLTTEEDLKKNTLFATETDLSQQIENGYFFASYVADALQDAVNSYALQVTGAGSVNAAGR